MCAVFPEIPGGKAIYVLIMNAFFEMGCRENAKSSGNYGIGMNFLLLVKCIGLLYFAFTVIWA